MGLIKAFAGSVFSYIGDMWEDYIYCDSLSNDVLVKRGHKKSSGGAGNRADDNVITEGSKIAVNAGQMLIVVENGLVTDFTAEPGGYEYNSRTEPSVFAGDLKDALFTSIQEIKNRFFHGGIPANDQRVFFVNLKEIVNNQFGFGNVPYRDKEFDMTILLQGYGVYSFRICNPLQFYENICGNVADQYNKATLLPQLRGELQNAMLPVLGELSKKGVHYDQMSLHTDDILSLLQENISGKWREARGIEMSSLAFSNILPDDDSMDKLRDLQESRVYSGNMAMLGARMGAASANAMESAAANPSGAVNGFMGMGMAQRNIKADVAEMMREGSAKSKANKANEEAKDKWTCSCGMVNSMEFCPKCGSKKPEIRSCSSCGYVFPKELEGMKFCPKCGNKI